MVSGGAVPSGCGPSLVEAARLSAYDVRRLLLSRRHATIPAMAAPAIAHPMATPARVAGEGFNWPGLNAAVALEECRVEVVPR